MTRAPLYLRPASYRRRRRRDVARLLPFVGGFLFLLPMLWAPARGVLRDTAHDGIFLFIAWAVMIVFAFATARSLRGHDADGGDPETDPSPDAPAPPRSG
jgi:hypothetical protein